MQADSVIEVKNLKKYYKSYKKDKGVLGSLKSLINREYKTIKAVDNITFNVAKGEIKGLIGPNGAGKSTTIKILSGILHETSGVVNVTNFHPWKNRINYVKNIGVVFGQKQQLWLDLPPLDTFYLNKQIYEIDEKTFHTNLKYLINVFQIKDVIKRPARHLSLGEKMKCEMVSCLLHDPAVVFLDEPTIGVDLIAKENIREFILRLNKEKNITFLLTTHDIDDIENLCEEIIIINKGKKVFDGKLETLKQNVLNTKFMHLKFKEKKNSFTGIKGITVLKNFDYEALLEINTKITSVKDILPIIIKKYRIIDMTVENPSIEKVIKKIYEK